MSVPGPDAKIAAAQAHATAARRRFGATVDVLKQRVSPQALAQDAADSLKDRGAALASDVADSVRRRPAVYAAAVASIAVFLARNRIAGSIGRMTGASPDRSSASPKSRKGPSK